MNEPIILKYKVDVDETKAYYAHVISSFKKKAIKTISKEMLILGGMFLLPLIFPNSNHSDSFHIFMAGAYISLCLIILIVNINKYSALKRAQKGVVVVHDSPRSIEILNGNIIFEDPDHKATLPITSIKVITLIKNFMVLTLVSNNRATNFIIYSSAFNNISRNDFIGKLTSYNDKIQIPL